MQTQNIIKIRHPKTGALISVKWDRPEPPSDDDIDEIVALEDKTPTPAAAPAPKAKEEPGFLSRVGPQWEGLKDFGKKAARLAMFPQSTMPEDQLARIEMGEGFIKPFGELGRVDRMMSPEGTPLIPEFAKFTSGLGENVGRFATGMMGADYDTLDVDVQDFQKDPSWRGARAIAGDVAIPVAMAAATHYGPKLVKGAVNKFTPKPEFGTPTNILHDQPALPPVEPTRQIAERAGSVPNLEGLSPADRSAAIANAIAEDTRPRVETRANRLLGEGNAPNLDQFVVSPEGSAARLGDITVGDTGLPLGERTPGPRPRRESGVLAPEGRGIPEIAGDVRTDPFTQEGTQRPGFATEYTDISTHPGELVLQGLVDKGKLTELQANTVRGWLHQYDDIRRIPQKFSIEEWVNWRTRGINQKLIDAFNEARRATHVNEQQLGYPHNVVPRRFTPDVVREGLPTPPPPNRRPVFSLEPEKMGKLPGEVVTPFDEFLEPPEIDPTTGKPILKEPYKGLNLPEVPSPLMEAGPDRTPLIEKVRRQPESPARSNILERLEAQEAESARTGQAAEGQRKGGTGQALADITEPIHHTNTIAGEAANRLAEERRIKASGLDRAIDSLPPSSFKDELMAQSGHVAKELGTIGTVASFLAKSGKRQLERMGPAGSSLAKLLGDFDTKASARGGEYVTQFHKIGEGLSKADKTIVAKLVAGQEVPGASPAARAAHTKIVELIDKVTNENAASGMQTETPMLPGTKAPFEKFTAEYFPERMRAKFAEKYYNVFKKNKTDFYNKLVKQGIPEKEALAHVDGLKRMGEEYLATKEGQTLMKGVEHDLSFNVLEQFLYETARNTETNTKFGAQITGPDSPITKLLDSLSGEEQKRAKDIVNDYLGRGEAPHRFVSNTAKNLINIEVATKLTGFMVKNFNDMYTVIRDGGYAKTLKEIGRALGSKEGRKASKASATQSGAFEIFHHNLIDDPTFGNRLGKAYGMEAVEGFIRQVGANVGKALVEDKFNQLVANPKNPLLRKELSSFLERPLDHYLEKGRLTPEDLNFAGGRFVELTSGKPNALSLPPAFFTRNPLARLPLLFRRFAFVASKNMKDSFLRTATREAPMASAKATAAKAARTISAAIILGELTGDTLAAIKAAIDPDEDIMEAIKKRGDLRNRIAADMMQSWLFGLVGDVYKAGSGGLMGSLKFMTGAVGSDVADVWTGVGNLAKTETAGGEKRTPTERWKTLRDFASRNVPAPVVGPGIGTLIDTPDKKSNKYVPKPPKVPKFTPANR